METEQRSKPKLPNSESIILQTCSSNAFENPQANNVTAGAKGYPQAS